MWWLGELYYTLHESPYRSNSEIIWKLIAKNTMTLYDRVGVVVALIALALFASVTLAWPTHDVALGGLSFALSGRMLLGPSTVGLAWAGTDAIVRSNPKVRPGQLHRHFLPCILPAAVTAAAWVLYAGLPTLENRAMGLAASAGVLALLIAAEYYAVDPAARWRGATRVLLELATYCVAALLYGTVYLTLLDVNVARAGTVVGALIALRLLGKDELPLARILWASLGVGLLLGAVSWLLHPRIITAIRYSLTLAVFLYVLTGLAGQLLWSKLRREVVVEYLLVGLAALVLVFLSMR